MVGRWPSFPVEGPGNVSGAVFHGNWESLEISHLKPSRVEFFPLPRWWEEESLNNFFGLIYHLGGGNSNILYFHPDPWGFMIQFDGSHIFQMGWFNHQLVCHQFTVWKKGPLTEGLQFAFWLRGCRYPTVWKQIFPLGSRKNSACWVLLCMYRDLEKPTHFNT